MTATPHLAGPIDAALAAANALLRLGRDERALLDEGRLEDLVLIAERRAGLVDQLDLARRAGADGPELAAVLRQVREEGLTNLARIESLKGDLAKELAGDAKTGRAVRGYGSGSAL